MPYLPRDRSLEALRNAAERCHGCALFRDATRTVFGHGNCGAPLMLVGEQPGDREDLIGLPFVGPAGRLLGRALADAGVDSGDPGQTYQTNAVKHFKFIRKSARRRIHQKPRRSEVVACRPWLLAEMAAVRPRVVVCLGATAAQSLLGTAFRVSARRGELLAAPTQVAEAVAPGPPPAIVATVHPSAVLRDRGDLHDAAYEAFVDDLRVARTASASA